MPGDPTFRLRFIPVYVVGTSIMDFDICATASGGLGLTYDFMFFDWDAVAEVLERDLGVSLAQLLVIRNMMCEDLSADLNDEETGDPLEVEKQKLFEIVRNEQWR